MEKIYKRENYLNKIRGFYNDDMIKVISGIRRCGKSFFLKSIIGELLENGINEKDFEGSKKKVYGEFVKDYNEISTISTILVADYFKNINSFDYFEDFSTVNKELAERVLKNIFLENRKVVSIVNPIED